MSNQIDTEIRERHHADFAGFLGGAISRLLAGFERLVAIEYDAPWRRR